MLNLKILAKDLKKHLKGVYKMIGIIYGSSTGNTENAATVIAEKISGSVMKNITEVDKLFVESCSSLILGTSTWGSGELQDDWAEGINIIKSSNLKGKKVALFGLGDQESWGESFVDAMSYLYKAVIEQGGEITGMWSTEGYNFSNSISIIDGKFAGLVLDEDNQAQLTKERINKWVSQLDIK